MRKETRPLTLWIADDGREFLSKKDCEAHENALKNVKYFASSCAPDLTEGRGYNHQILFVVNDDQHVHQQRCLQWLIDNKGRVLSYVMGVSPMLTWTGPHEITAENFQQLRKQPCEIIVISQTKIEGLPDQIRWVK